MHLEILIEDGSGKAALDTLVPKIIGGEHTFVVHAYKGIGRIPKNLKPGSDPARRVLLDQLPKLLQGYGNTYANSGYAAAVVVVCDLDDKCLKSFRESLLAVLNACKPKPETRFCFAIEESEAWLLGDIAAVRKAYPKVKSKALAGYINDSICGTWEVLADAIYPGGALKLASQGYPAAGAEKFCWAINISPHMDIENNQSASFCYFRNTLRALTNE